MLKIAYQLGVQAAFDEAGLGNMTKEASKAGLLRRGLNWAKGHKTLIGGGLGLGALGTGLALYPREEEQSALSRMGDTAKSLLGNQQLMGGLTQALAGGMGGGGLGLTAGDESGTFPPSPDYGQGAYPAQGMPQGMSPEYSEYM